MTYQLTLPSADGRDSSLVSPGHPALEEELASFAAFGTPTLRSVTQAVAWDGTCITVPTYVNEFWTAKQRAAHSLHEVSYRACFKPQLPRFFIERLTGPGDLVYDPFMGRGTTPLEAALLGRTPLGCDVNPLSRILVEPRLRPPLFKEVAERLASLDLSQPNECPEDLLAFYHSDTLKEICSLRAYLLARQETGDLDHVDSWIRLVAVNRLTGHSPGFFSVYTLPPNQAVSADRQRLINARRNQSPPRRDIRGLVLAKTRAMLADCDEATRRRLTVAAESRLLLTADSKDTPEIPDRSVSLVVTSPPFLDVVDYAGDNWLRCWFCGIDPLSVRLSILRKVEEWQTSMAAVFRELERILRPDGHVAFEVGEVRGGTVRLEEAVIPAGRLAGLSPRLVLINQQKFTKTANCWGVDNGRKGTNTNRVVLFRKPA